MKKLSGQTLHDAARTGAGFTVFGIAGMAATLLYSAVCRSKPTNRLFYASTTTVASFVTGTTAIVVSLGILESRIKRAVNNLQPGQMLIAGIISREKGGSAAAEVEHYMALEPFEGRLAVCVYLEDSQCILVTPLPGSSSHHAVFSRTLAWFYPCVRSISGPGLHVHYGPPSLADRVL